MEEAKGFDMEEYVKKRMLEIPQLEERKLYKEIVGNLITELYRYNERAYKELEERILAESIPQETDYSIYLTMTDRGHYDETDEFLYPMQEEDTKKKEISYEEISLSLAEGKPLKLFTVFLQGKASMIYKLLTEKRIFHGIIKTTNREYRADFTVKRNDYYLEKIKELYYVFAANGKRWTTVCEAYLTKFLDVYLYAAEEMKKEENILEIVVDFEEYSQMIRHDVFPLWNLCMVREKTSTYPEPGIDRINYEHRIFAHRLIKECEYLVANREMEITNIRRMNGDLIITCTMENPQEWEFYRVHKEPEKMQYPYPVLSNRHKESFADSLTRMYQQSIKTKAEMARMIESFPYADYVEFCDLKIMENAPADWEASNYNMDGFIQDEIRIGKNPQVMCILFMEKDMGNYLNEDIMSFMVTQVQKIFPEYLCVGKLV